jgi:hypothetical protein
MFDQDTLTTDVVWPEFRLTLPLRWREHQPGSLPLDFRCADLPDQLIVQRVAVPPEELRSSVEELLNAMAESAQSTARGRAIMTGLRVVELEGGVLEGQIHGVAEQQRVQFALLARGERSAILGFGLYRYTLERVGAPVEVIARAVLDGARADEAFKGMMG